MSCYSSSSSSSGESDDEQMMDFQYPEDLEVQRHADADVPAEEELVDYVSTGLFPVDGLPCPFCGQIPVHTDPEIPGDRCSICDTLLAENAEEVEEDPGSMD